MYAVDWKRLHYDGKLSCLQPNGIFEGNTELHCYEYRVADRYTSGRPDDLLDFTWQLLHLVVFVYVWYLRRKIMKCLVVESEEHNGYRSLQLLTSCGF